MTYIQQLLTELSSRLPELEWKISNLNAVFPMHRLPKGLFSSNRELTGSICVDEIKANIQSLANQNNHRSAVYLAARIQQKITVLVALCQIDSRKKKKNENSHFSLKMLSTRQQWLHDMETAIDSLVIQQQALAKSLEHLQQGSNTAAILNLQSELGALERRLTIAQEALWRSKS